MAYLSLYRRLRPLTFAQITGQEHVTRTLSHALARGQLAHAYLFCGPRGTGKTTTAKILARAVNCERYPIPEPCGECTSCRNIASGVSLDVIEMDAASNRGIDEIRELRERTRYASGESRYKVYIIDEAHMLTNEACNAFLKTLEEPPPGVIFILATTDPSRLPPTIVSRCQRFDFHLLTVEQIGERLRRAVAEEGWQAEEEALRLIARLAEGSMRDALGLLEQCGTYGEETITAEHVRALTGVTRVETIGALIEALATGDLEAGLQTLQEIVYGGRDLALLLRDLTFFFSRLLLAGSSGRLQLEESYYGFAGLLKQYRGRFSREALLDLVELLHELAGELRYAHYPQFVLEVGLIRMMRLLHREARQPDTAAPPPPAERPRAREAAVKAVKTATGQAGPPSKRGPGKEPPARPETKTAAAQEAAAVAADWWERLLVEVKKQNKATFRHLNAACAHSLEGNLLILTYYRGDFAGERIQEKEHRGIVEEGCRRLLKRPLQLQVRYGGEPPESVAGEEMPQPKDSEASYSFEEVEKLFPGEVFEL
ncbi:MAG: DNA polymerase III subunit gamma/tau [Firmicutes bacterium]|jgi:DNA polymerase-3 subunit gamma/tau|nr:DNA polymerase III subunit gamma/tau [Bacillota bacterium]HPU01591.1 DNA polymerase III subunit gamma/tau [Bacillota bacterium]